MKVTWKVPKKQLTSSAINLSESFDGISRHSLTFRKCCPTSANVGSCDPFKTLEGAKGEATFPLVRDMTSRR